MSHSFRLLSLGSVLTISKENAFFFFLFGSFFFFFFFLEGGLYGGLDGRVSAYNAGDPGSIPGLGRSPGEGNGNPLQYSCLENPMDRGA